MPHCRGDATWICALDVRCETTRLGACPTMTVLLRRTIRDHLRRARPEKILTVFQRIHLRFFRACGLASGRTSFASSRTAMSDRLPASLPPTLNVSLPRRPQQSSSSRSFQVPAVWPPKLIHLARAAPRWEPPSDTDRATKGTEP